ncbi:MAG: cytochrome b/b6 domain-containing protein [Pseudohongiella sp.]|nr:cytochrome b/b6 domain-containing protein [Pseudohongiella sp.]MDO9520753.1 cytochrome b/b6 domain-containing protein [Pseudohongiella sp.]
MKQSNSAPRQAYKVWDRTTRIFHWLNVICVLLLIVVGVIILNATMLGVSPEGKVSLKILHVYIGYIFTLNLLWRLVWGFVGGKYSRWKSILPGGKDYIKQSSAYVDGFRKGDAPAYKGHNPLGRIMIAVMLFLLSAQMVTGLVLAGTDLYFPPFGHEFAEWATGAGENHSMLIGLEPGQKEMLDPEGYASMREFRAPFVEIHEIIFYLLMLAIVLHVAAVVITEVRERSGLVSAMFSGIKYLDKKPVD